MGVIPMQRLDLVNRILGSLNGRSDGGGDMTAHDGQAIDVKTSRNAPTFAFSRSNRHRHKAPILAFAGLDWMRDGGAYVELMGWAYRNDVETHLTEGRNFFDLDVERLRRHGLLHKPFSLLTPNPGDTPNE